MLEFKVRPALPRDAAAIAGIYNQGIEDRIATFEVEPRSEADIITALSQRGTRYPTVVVISGPSVAGVAWASPYHSRSCYHGVAEFSVYVERGWRGKGVGRTAMLELIERCDRLGFCKLVSRVFPENIPSLRLLASIGFREVGTYRRHAKLDGVWRDCVIVERLLTAAQGGAQTHNESTDADARE